MIDEILDGCGVLWKRGGWYPTSPPDPPFAVLLESVEVGGADLKVLEKVTNSTIELYTDSTGKKWQSALSLIEGALIGKNISFERYQPVYVESERWYLTVIETKEQLTKL